MTDDTPKTLSPEALEIIEGVAEVIDEPKVQTAFKILKNRRGDGLGSVDISFLRALAVVGKYARTMGMRDLTRGAQLRGQQIIGEEMQAVQLDIQELEKTNPLPRQKKVRDEIDRLRQRLEGYMSKLTEGHKIMLATEGTLIAPAPFTEAPPTAQSFAAGQTVGPGTTIISQHTTVNPPAEPPKTPTPPPAV